MLNKPQALFLTGRTISCLHSALQSGMALSFSERFRHLQPLYKSVMTVWAKIMMATASLFLGLL